MRRLHSLVLLSFPGFSVNSPDGKTVIMMADPYISTSIHPRAHKHTRSFISILTLWEGNPRLIRNRSLECAPPTHLHRITVIRKVTLQIPFNNSNVMHGAPRGIRAPVSSRLLTLPAVSVRDVSQRGAGEPSDPPSTAYALICLLPPPLVKNRPKLSSANHNLVLSLPHPFPPLLTFFIFIIPWLR